MSHVHVGPLRAQANLRPGDSRPRNLQHRFDLVLSQAGVRGLRAVNQEKSAASADRSGILLCAFGCTGQSLVDTRVGVEGAEGCAGRAGRPVAAVDRMAGAERFAERRATACTTCTTARERALWNIVILFSLSALLCSVPRGGHRGLFAT